MCVLVEDYDLKTITLPKIVVRGRRPNPLDEMMVEITLQNLNVVWNAGTSSFEPVETTAADVKVITPDKVKAKPTTSPTTIVEFTEVSRTIVAGQWVVTIEFKHSDGTTTYENYVVSQDRYWYNEPSTGWWSVGDFTSGNDWTQEPVGPTLASFVPPPTGGGDPGQNAN